MFCIYIGVVSCCPPAACTAPAVSIVSAISADRILLYRLMVHCLPVFWYSLSYLYVALAGF